MVCAIPVYPRVSVALRAIPVSRMGSAPHRTQNFIEGVARTKRISPDFVLHSASQVRPKYLGYFRKKDILLIYDSRSIDRERECLRAYEFFPRIQLLL